MKYKVQCIRRGVTEVEAESEDEAVEIAEGLPAGAYSWSGPEEHDLADES